MMAGKGLIAQVGLMTFSCLARVYHGDLLVVYDHTFKLKSNRMATMQVMPQRYYFLSAP
jgi:hypothetical protein